MAARKAMAEARSARNQALREAEKARREALAVLNAVEDDEEEEEEAQRSGTQLHVRFSSRSVLGGLFAVIGAAFLAESLGYFEFKRVYLWPMLLIAMGLSQLLGRSERQRVEKKRSGQLAVAEERVKIARELHDIVAHSVSLMTVQIAAARRVFHVKPDQAEAALASAEATGRQSLDELRNIVNVLRGADRSFDELGDRKMASEQTQTEPLPGLPQVPGLIKAVRDVGTDVTLSIHGDEPEVSPSVGITVYRIVQEGLTNAIRHAPGAKVRVQLSYSESEIIVVVQDEGGAEVAQRDGGHGLIGMRERVQAAGGSLVVGPSGEGWRVEAKIPLERH